MSLRLSIITGCLTISACGQISTVEQGAFPDPSPKYLLWTTQAEAYPAAVEVRLVVDNDVFDKNYRVIERPATVRVLSAKERRDFGRALLRQRVIGPAPDGDLQPDAPACFVPHHFFRYYDRAGLQVGEVAVCFCCYQARAAPEIIEGDRRTWFAVNVSDVKALVRGMGLPTQQQCDPEES